MSQDRNPELEDVVLQRYGLQAHLHATDSKIWTFSLVKIAHERLEHHFGRSVVSHLWVEASLTSFAGRLLHGLAYFTTEAVAAHRTRLNKVVPLVLNSLELDPPFIVEL